MISTESSGADTSQQKHCEDESSVRNNNVNNQNSIPAKKNDHLHQGSNGMFTMNEYKTLAIICDTIFSDDSQEFEQSVQGETDNPKHLNSLKDYFKRKSSDLDLAGEFLKLLSKTRSSTQISDFKTLLYLFSAKGAGFILTGSLNNFTGLNLKTRQSILSMMKTSNNPIRRQAYKAIVPLAISLFYTIIPPSNDGNPNWDAVNYIGPTSAEQIPGEEKLSFIKITSETSLKADVVVIGSGAGGGVTAALLSQAGYKVIVMEKGSYVSSNNMTWKEGEAFPLMYEQAGTLTSDDLSVNILAGSCLGGGTTVNWTASIRTPEPILEEWRKQCPNTFSSAKFNQAMDSVSERLSVTTNYSTGHHNKNNLILEQALLDLQDEPAPIPRNVKNCDTTQCGSCSMGCRSKSKQSSMVTYLEDCCSNGGQIITNCQAEQITYTDSPQGQTVHGVIGFVTTPDGVKFRVFIKTHIVVCAAGAIHTPALLLKSSIKNSNIGNNLYLHPAIPVIAGHDEIIDLYKGPPMTIIGRKFQKINPTNNKLGGAIIECPNAHLGVASSVCSFFWDKSFSFKKELLDINKFSSFITILRDTTPGKIRLDKDGRTPKIIYKLSNQDWKSSMIAAEASFRSLMKMGAKKAAIPVNGLEPCTSIDQIESYIKSLRSIGYKPNQAIVLSAHQMGSCRMGSNRSNSVVNENGESWDVKRLFIADGSVLPSSVGINPMITIYSVSHIIANQIIQLYPPTNINITYEREN
ncbi:hypothetical protein DICPUDRAFT_159608 [Dictyostelium purpureum]|uniref:Long-chain-alcohol oxidase n=1 Tax=Dictyostelium purpureum TaxID=5786 RepID=F1A4J2_DICPU|nr:uncharacterized protein DICPUDRAFT_159608 [Dictyostelium purpureum]EGC28895.1 hypothetical protein DICPUDRAFT_159608 [Dictyostelium purpureum]|eukprot:XP_003294587.1 hypothetical protein DICPUDRAFT_159608 [Dictyostelium purpureum]